MEQYPETATERFDNATFHIKYCLSVFRKYIKGNILEIGAGCGSFTRHYCQPQMERVTLTEMDAKNISELKTKFKKDKNIQVLNLSIEKVDNNFDSILYLHVLEHIEDDLKELKNAIRKLNSRGHIIIMVPAHQKVYSNLDKAVGHFRRYEKDFFKNNLLGLELVNFKYLDAMGYLLYYLNRIFFKKETFPSKLKIFLWDKIFTPVTVIIDFITNYRLGKCIIAIYRKN
tara:strand:- start:434 stop:1120 length:687 start_codon:yes stop_codon:yes gene_type:complete